MKHIEVEPTKGKKELIGAVDEKQLAAWKAEYKTVYELVVDDAVAYLRKPNRQDLSAATALAKNDSYLFNEILLNSCWLGGADIIKTDDEYFLSIGPSLADLIEVKHAELKKI